MVCVYGMCAQVKRWGVFVDLQGETSTRGRRQEEKIQQPRSKSANPRSEGPDANKMTMGRKETCKVKGDLVPATQTTCAATLEPGPDRKDHGNVDSSFLTRGARSSALTSRIVEGRCRNLGNVQWLLLACGHKKRGSSRKVTGAF